VPGKKIDNIPHYNSLKVRSQNMVEMGPVPREAVVEER